MTLYKFKYIKNNPSEDHMIQDISKTLRKLAKDRSWPSDWEEKCKIDCQQNGKEYSVEVKYE